MKSGKELRPQVRWGRTGCLFALAGLLGLVLVVYFISGWNSVDSGKVGVTRRFGEVTGTHEAGGFWEQPIGFSMVEYDLRVAKTISDQRTALCNQQTLVINSAAYQYNLTPLAARKLLETVGTQETFEHNVVIPKLQNAMKKVTPKYCADQVFPQRSQMEQEMESNLAEDLKRFDVDPSSVDITLADIDFDKAYQAAIDAKARAEQEKQVEQANLEKQKIQNERELQQARTDASKAAVAAQGEANAAQERAKGDAQSTRLRASAQAEANALLAKALTQDLISYEYLQRWNGQLPSTMLGSGAGTPLVTIPGQSPAPSTPPASNAP